MNHTIKHIRSDLSGGENYCATQIEIKAGHTVSPHWHDYFEFELVLEGYGEQIYNGTRYVLERGTVSLLSYYDFHALRITDDLKLLKIQFNENMLPKDLSDFIFLSQNRFCCSLSEEETREVIRLMENIMDEDASRSQFYELMVRNAISTLMVMLLRRTSSLPAPAMPSLIQKTAAYAHTHFRENISLTQAAEACSVTPNYLGKRFTQWMGVSFSEYLNTVRLRHACNVLTGTDLSVKEIAFSSGYNSIEHFEYIFKRKLACTPTAFRRLGRARETVTGEANKRGRLLQRG